MLHMPSDGRSDAVFLAPKKGDETRVIYGSRAAGVIYDTDVQLGENNWEITMANKVGYNPYIRWVITLYSWAYYW